MAEVSAVARTEVGHTIEQAFSLQTVENARLVADNQRLTAQLERQRPCKRRKTVQVDSNRLFAAVENIEAARDELIAVEEADRVRELAEVAPGAAGVEMGGMTFEFQINRAS